jgi:hypothetical protein
LTQGHKGRLERKRQGSRVMGAQQPDHTQGSEAGHRAGALYLSCCGLAGLECCISTLENHSWAGHTEQGLGGVLPYRRVHCVVVTAIDCVQCHAAQGPGDQEDRRKRN